MNKTIEIIRSIFFHSAKRTFYAVTIAIVLVSLPITLFAVRQQQDLRQSAAYGVCEPACPSGQTCDSAGRCIETCKCGYYYNYTYKQCVYQFSCVTPAASPTPGATWAPVEPSPTPIGQCQAGYDRVYCTSSHQICCPVGSTCTYSSTLGYRCSSTTTNPTPTKTPTPTPTRIPSATNTPTPSTTNNVNSLSISSIVRVPNTYTVGTETNQVYNIVLRNTSTSVWTGTVGFAGFYNYPSNTFNDANNCVSNVTGFPTASSLQTCPSITAGTYFPQINVQINNLAPGALTQPLRLPVSGGWPFAGLQNMDIYFIVRLHNVSGTAANPVKYTYTRYFIYANTPTPSPTRTPTPLPPSATSTSVPDCATNKDGDANCNGVVDLSDYAIWWNQSKYGFNKSPQADADFDGDLDADINDYNIWYATMNESLK